MSEGQLTGVEADGHCFVCGQENDRGLRASFHVDRDQGRSSARLVLTEGLQGWADVVHGGILAALLDEACIYACRSRGEQFVTAELTVKYRKPVPLGVELLVSGELLESRRRLWNARAQICIGTELYAEATARVFALDEQG